MPDTNATTTVTTAPAAGASTATPAPKPGEASTTEPKLNAEQKFAARMKAAKEKIAAEQAERAAPPEEKKTEAGPSPKETELVKELARVTAKHREAVAKLAELEPHAKPAAEYKEIRELYAKDPIEALGKLTGKDGIDAMADLMAVFHELEASETGQPGAKRTPDPELAEIKATLAELKAERAKNTEADTKRQEAEQRSNADRYAQSIAQKDAAKFEVSLRPANIAEATDLAHAATVVIAQRDGIDLANPDAEAIERVIAEAWAEVETELRSRGANYAPTPKAAPPPAFDPVPRRPLTRTPPPRVAALPPKPRWEDRLAHARERYDAARNARKA